MELIQLMNVRRSKGKRENKNLKFNFIIKEKKETLGIYLLDNIELILCDLFGNKRILEHLIGFEKNDEWVAIHIRGTKTFIVETCKVLKNKFSCKETTTERDLNIIVNCSPYLKRWQRRYEKTTMLRGASYAKILRQLAQL